MPRLHLLIDADDTLWENNIYFEAAFDDFVSFLSHSRLSAAEVRAVLDEIELVNNKIHGYGSLNFGRNLREAYQHLAERHINEEDLQTVMGFAERILEHPIDLIAGVPETLAYLSERHELTLFTKGHPDEQQLKVDRSGIGHYFAHTMIVKEKDPDTYRQLLTTRSIEPSQSWMIGNSPKSDINPALAVGMNAVYVPHDRTWHLERTELGSGVGTLLVVNTFADLARHF